MIKLTPFTPQNFDSLISWIDNEELLITIAGTVFTYPLTAPQLQTYLEDEKSHSFNVVDTESNEVIGHAELVVSGHDTFKIDKLIIGDQSKRGRGTGQAVIKELLSYSFSKLKAATVELNVFDWNLAGIRCYQKCGFKTNHEKQMPFEVGDKNWLAFNMTINKDEWQANQ